jgi:aspartyl-tRNA(Asn)/glutamyl-tRNA(Gln) amidotransferase subunit A
MWMMGNLSTLLPELGTLWPKCAKDLTDEVALGVYLSQALYNLESAAVAERQRLELHEAMARAFDQVDFVIASTNPGPAFKAESTKSADVDIMDKVLGNAAARVGLRGALTGISMVSGAFHRFPSKLVETMESKFPDLVAMGGLTIASNVYGNPAVSIPAGLVDGLPVGAQVLAPHHRDGLLFDVALGAERAMPWPLVAPSVERRGATVGARL